MTLKEIILAEILQSAARKNGFDNWESFERQGDYTDYINADRKALRESLDRLDSIMRWAMKHGWHLSGHKDLDTWFNSDYGEEISDAELLQLYKEKNDEKGS